MSRDNVFSSVNFTAQGIHRPNETKVNLSEFRKILAFETAMDKIASSLKNTSSRSPVSPRETRYLAKIVSDLKEGRKITDKALKIAGKIVYALKIIHKVAIGDVYDPALALIESLQTFTKDKDDPVAAIVNNSGSDISTAINDKSDLVSIKNSIYHREKDGLIQDREKFQKAIDAINFLLNIRDFDITFSLNQIAQETLKMEREGRRDDATFRSLKNIDDFFGEKLLDHRFLETRRLPASSIVQLRRATKRFEVSKIPEENPAQNTNDSWTSTVQRAWDSPKPKEEREDPITGHKVRRRSHPSTQRNSTNRVT